MLDRKLEIFQMAATLLNFTRAATALGMTQSNVTQQIRMLEEELQTPLFERDGRKLHLTAAGQVLLARGGDLLTMAQVVKREVHNAASAWRCYRIGGTMTAGGYVLGKYLAGYMLRHPACVLSLHIANTNDIAGQLKTRQLDLALVEGPFDQEIFFAQPFLRDELVAVAAPGFFSGGTISLAEYLATRKRLILREKGSGTRHAFEQFLLEHRLPHPAEESVVEINGFDAIKQLVRSHFGITVISELAVADELRSGTLSCARFAEGRLERQMNFIYLPDEHLKFSEDFILFCRNHGKSLKKCV